MTMATAYSTPPTDPSHSGDPPRSEKVNWLPRALKPRTGDVLLPDFLQRHAGSRGVWHHHCVPRSRPNVVWLGTAILYSVIHLVQRQLARSSNNVNYTVSGHPI